MKHKTVLLREAVDELSIKSGNTVVDATFGAGGHAQEIIKRLAGTGTFIGIDADEKALDVTKLGDTKSTVHLVNDNFGHLRKILSSLHIEAVDAVLADLGWRMEQFSDNQKGFSFLQSGPLYMTFGQPEKYPFTAEDIVNDWAEEVLADIIFGYGEERFARRIAKAIVEHRQYSRIIDSKELAEIVEGAVPARFRKRRIHPATKTFQALRIAVNDELGVLETFLTDAFALLKPGGRLAVITFHSLEDRVVKHRFKELKQAGRGVLVHKKPITPTREEIENNPRARSAKLRIITKV